MTNQGRRRQSNQPLVWINQSMQLAVDRPWRYVATWAIGIGGANFGLGMLLNDRSMTDNARTATLYGIGCWVLARVYFMQHARRLRQIRPRYAATPAGPKQRGAPRWRSGIPVRRAAASRGPRSRRRWSCPRHGEPLARPGGRPPTPSMPQSRPLVLAAVAVTAVTVALLVVVLAN